MSAASKSPRRVLQEAWKTAQAALPAYAHRFSPKKYTQHQLFACLVLKAHQKADYRGVMALLRDCPEWCRAIGMTAVPHHTTLLRASRRLLTRRGAAVLLEMSVRRIMGGRQRVAIALADSSGFEPTGASRYYLWRSGRLPKAAKGGMGRRYPKLGLICDASNHAILSAVPGVGPRPDVDQLRGLMDGIVEHPVLERLVADSGYDSEPNHRLLREEHGVRSLIPPESGRPCMHGRMPAGKYRRLMVRRFDWDLYHQRSQVETVMSMLKRNLGSWARGRDFWSQCRELLLKVLTHNIMVRLMTWDDELGSRIAD